MSRPPDHRTQFDGTQPLVPPYGYRCFLCDQQIEVGHNAAVFFDHDEQHEARKTTYVRMAIGTAHQRCLAAATEEH